MSTKLKSRFTSLGGVDYEIFLDKGRPSGPTALVQEISVRSASRTYKQESQDIDAHLLTSKLEVVYYVTDDSQKFILGQLLRGKEMEYRLRLLREGELEWVGFVLIDLASREFAADRYDFSVVATDGIARLKNIPYDPSTVAEFATFHERFVHILSQIPLTDYYQEQTYLRVHSTIWPDGLRHDIVHNQLDLIRLNVKALRTVNEQGEITYQKVYDVLLQLCQIAGLRLTYSRGGYSLYEIADYSREGQTLAFHKYAIDATPQGAELQSGWGVYTRSLGGQDFILAGGKETFLPPLRAVEVTYKHYSRQNLFPGESGTWGSLSAIIRTVKNFGTDGGAGTISISGAVQVQFSDQASLVIGASKSSYLRLAVRIAVVDPDDDNDGKGLNRPVIMNSAGSTYGPTTWADGGISNAAYLVVSLPPPGYTSGTTLPFVIDTPPVPVSGDLRFTISGEGLFVDGGPVDPSAVRYTVTDLFVESLLAGSIEDQYNEDVTTAENADFLTNSVVLEREHLFGDGPGDNTFGRIEYQNRGTGTWQLADGWRRWGAEGFLSEESMSHSALIAWMTLGLQSEQRRRLDITVVALDYSPEQLVEWKDETFVCAEAEQDILKDEWRGRWRQVTFAPPAPPRPPKRWKNISPGSLMAPRLPEGAAISPTIITPPERGGGDPPGQKQPGLNTVPGRVADGLAEGVLIEELTLENTPQELPIFAGDELMVTDPVTGTVLNVRARYNYAQGAPTNADDPLGTPMLTADGGIIFLGQPGGLLGIDGATPTVQFPADSLIQYDPGYLLRLYSLFRRDTYPADIVDFDEPLSVGFCGWFWRPAHRVGDYIRAVNFSFGQAGGEAKVNLKYYDHTGLRYTVATYAGGGLGGRIVSTAEVQPGYYRVEVEQLTGAPPKGLHLILELTKMLTE